MADLVQLDQILTVPGRLVWNPTQALSTAFPYGGTAFGQVVDVAIQAFETVEKLTEEEFGEAPIETVFLGEAWAIGFSLVEFDVNALAIVFPNASVGPDGGIVLRGGREVGTLGTSLEGKILFAPLDPTKRFFIMRKAIPRLLETAELIHDLESDLTFPCIFHAHFDDSDQPFDFGFKEDLTI